MKDWKEEKARILALPLDERRKLYTCGDQFVPLSQISTWSEQQAKSQETEEKPADYHNGDVDPKVVENKEGEITEGTTASNNDAKIEQAKVEYDPGWIKQLKDDLAKDVEDKKIELNLDISSKVSLFIGDITKLELDAIVNAANSSLLGGGGVDGAIHRAAGKLLYLENRDHNGCEEGEAKSSGGYYLPSKFVISTVGPQGEYPQILSNCYYNCLTLLSNNSLKSIAFPCISTGIYGYPNTGACSVALRTVRKWLEEENNYEKIDRIVFCLFLQKDQEIYNKMLPLVFPSTCSTQPAKL